MGDRLTVKDWFFAVFAFIAVFIFLAGAFLWNIFAILLVLGGAGTFFLANVSNWNAVPLFLASALMFAVTLYLHKKWRPHYRKKEKKKKNWLYWPRTAFITLLVFLGFLLATQVFHHQFSPYTAQYEYNEEKWIFQENLADLADLFIFWNSYPTLTEKEQSLFVVEYFDNLQRERHLFAKWSIYGELSDAEAQELRILQNSNELHEREVLRIISSQMTAVITEEGLATPALAGSFGDVFTYRVAYSGFFRNSADEIVPINFRLERRLNWLIIARRDKLEIVQRFYLVPELTPVQRDEIEKQIDQMGYSALVTGLGGLSTYPTTVIAGSLYGTLGTIAHEWTHNYMALRPLGRAERTTTRNAIEETTANIVGAELRSMVWERYYAQYVQVPSTQASPVADTRIDFNLALREIYETVKNLLAEGKITEAEQYMQERRDWLETEGYYVRKINQAYLTFRGQYATNPAFQEAHDGVGTKLLQLRKNTSSLAEFFHIVKNITNLEELKTALRQAP